MDPWGWDFAKSLDVNPLHSSNVIANASDIPMAVITLDVGVKFSGHASEGTPQSITISDDFAKDDSLSPTTDMILIFSNI